MKLPLMTIKFTYIQGTSSKVNKFTHEGKLTNTSGEIDLNICSYLRICKDTTHYKSIKLNQIEIHITKSYRIAIIGFFNDESNS